MTYYNLIKLAENQASNEQSSGPSVMGTVGLGAGLGAGAGAARIGYDLYARGAGEKKWNLESIDINKEKMVNAKNQLAKDTEKYNKKVSDLRASIDSNANEVLKVQKEGKVDRAEMLDEILTSRRNVLRGMEKSHTQNTEDVAKEIEDLRRKNVKHVDDATNAHTLKKYWQRLTKPDEYGIDRPAEYRKHIGKTTAIGAGLGALGYGGYKAYQHFKNKDK